MTVRRVDLNLFRVFEVVMRHRGVAAAGRELNITASAVSHALARLRQLLDDQLFVPCENGMEPTPRALELAPTINEGLRRFLDAIDSADFDARTSSRTFQLAMSDYASTVVLPQIVACLSKAAPNIDLRIFPLSRLDLVENLEVGKIDMAFGWFSKLPSHMRRMTATTESEALVARVGHPLTSETVTVERLFAFPHIVVELSGSGTPTQDGFLDERGVVRRIWIERLLLEQAAGHKDLVGRVAISLPHYSAVPRLVANSDMIATLPLAIAQREVKREPLVILDFPEDYDPASVPVEAVWHGRSDRDAGLQWFISDILGAVGALSSPRS